MNQISIKGFFSKFLIGIDDPSHQELAELNQEDKFYESAIKKRAKKREKESFFNGSVAHAAIVMGNIFRETAQSKKEKKVIKIYARTMNGEISHHLYYRKFLQFALADSSTALEVILDEQPNEDELFTDNAYEILKHAYIKDSDKVNIRVLKNEGKSNIRSIFLKKMKVMPGSHFAVSTENMYRFETYMGKGHHSAECNFNDSEYSKTLINLFNQHFNNENYTKKFEA